MLRKIMASFAIAIPFALVIGLVPTAAMASTADEIQLPTPPALEDQKPLEPKEWGKNPLPEGMTPQEATTIEPKAPATPNATPQPPAPEKGAPSPDNPAEGAVPLPGPGPRESAQMVLASEYDDMYNTALRYMLSTGAGLGVIIALGTWIIVLKRRIARMSAPQQ